MNRALRSSVGNNKGACREARPLHSVPSENCRGYFNASMPAPKLM